MPKPNPHRPFTPNPDMMARRPDITGNTINGAGEDTARRPDVVFWAPDPDDIAFGDVQKWFYVAQPDSAAMREERAKRQVVLDAVLPDVNPVALQQSGEAWTQSLDQFVEAGDCEMVGVTAMRDEWLFEGEETPFTTVIILARIIHDTEMVVV